MSEKSKSLTQEESQGQHPQTSEEVAPSPIQQEAPAQHPQASEGIKLPLTQEESPTQHPQTPEEGEPSPTQTETPAKYPESLEGIEPVPAQSEATVQHPNPLGEVKPSATHQEAPRQHLQSYEEVNPSATQQEATAQHPEPSGEVEPSPTQQEVPAHPPEHHVVTVSPLGQSQTELLLFSKVTVKHVDLARIITPESPNEVETSLPQQEASAQPAVSPEQLEPSAIQQEFPEQHPAPAENVEPSPVQQGVPTQTGDLPEETELTPSQQWSSSLPQMPVVGVKPSPVQPEHQAQPPESSTDIVARPPVHHEVIFSPLGPGEAQHPMLPNITVKPVDLEVFITPVPTKSEHSPGQQEATAQVPVPPEQVEFSPAQSKLLFQSPEIPEDEFPPGQQELILQTRDPPKEMEPTSAQQEVPAEPSEPPKEIEPSANEYAVSAHSPGPTEDVKPPAQPEVPSQPPVPQQVPAISPEPPKEVEPSPTQRESPAQSLELADKAEPLRVSQETPSQVLQFPEKVESSPVLQKAPSLPLEPLKEVELSPAQQVAQIQPSELPEKLESFPILQQASTQPPEPHQEAEPSPAQPPEPSKEAEPQLPVHNEMTVPHQGQDQAQHSSLPSVTAKPVDLELTVPPEPSTTLQPTPAPPEDPEVILPHPEHVEAQRPNLSEVTVQPLDLELTITPEPITQEFVVQPPMYQEVTVPTPGQDQAQHLLLPNVTVQPLDLELTISPEPTTKDLEVTFAHQEQVQAQHPILTEVTVQPLDLGLTITPEFTKEIELPRLMQETPIQLPEPPKEVTVAQSPESQEETIPTPGWDQTQHPSSPNVTVQPLYLELTVSPEPTTEIEHSTALKKTTEQVLSHRPNLTKVTVQPLDLELTITPASTTEIEPSPAMPLVLPKELVAQPSIYQEAAVPMSAQDQAQHCEVEQSTTLHQTTAPPKDLEVTFPPSKQVQVQHSTLNKVTVKPLDLGLTISPEPTTETKPSPTMQETPTQPPEPPKEVAVQYPFHQEGTVPTLGQDQAPYPTSPKPTTQVECSTTTKTTTPPPKDLEMALAHVEQIQSQHPNLTEVTVPPMDLEITVTAGSNMEVEPSPAMQETPTQPPEPPKEVVVQYPFHQEVMIPTPSKGEGQHPESPSITSHHVGLGLTIIPEPITEAKHSATTKKTTAPSPADLEVTLAHPERVQSQQANLTEVTVPVPPMDLEITVSHQPESSESVLPPTTQHSVVHFAKYFPEKAYTTLTEQPEQNVTTNANICELCTCKDERLSCSGFSPKQRLRRVPVPEPNMDNNTFTILNFQGNSISYIEENTWKAYRWTEKLILSENYLTELHKDSFEGLLSLQYFFQDRQELKEYVTSKPALRCSNTRISLLILEIIIIGAPACFSLCLCLCLSLPLSRQSERERGNLINRVLNGPKDLQKRHYKESAQSFVKNMPKERRLSRPSPRELEELHMAQRPRKLVGNSVHTEPSFIKEHKAAASSFLKQYIMGRPSASTAPKSLPKVREMEASRPVSYSGKKYIFHKIHSRIFRKKNSLLNILMPAQRPPLPAVRSLIDSPSQEAISSSEEQTQENPFSELFTLSEPSKENTTVENTTAQNVSEEIISPGSTTVSEQTPPEFTNRRNLSTTYSTTTRDNFVQTVKQTNETQWEYHNLLSSAGDLFEIQLNQQLRSLIPNNDVRRLISHVIWTLKMDCSEANVQLACARLISRTGLLMKLLIAQQEVKVSKAEWDTDQWKTENYINESTEAQSEQKGQESSEIYSHRAAAVEDEEGGSRFFFHSLLHKRCSIERESQSRGNAELTMSFLFSRRAFSGEGGHFGFGTCRDLSMPHGKKTMAQKLHNRDSSDEKESETVLSPTELQNLDYNSMSESQFRSTIIKLLVALEKSIKDSRDFMTAEFRSIRQKLKIN
ncbi:unnamed protein product [Nyctereutes procyonoides]|uniref:(raccoon dog) hypothetical protein n=1 Tax=Nyctereutes procyonoides TaxID=34880 RepID=A0A811YNS6_NYCPR|nr:unnamed protein product [Nyctereutes procyonoides]